MTKSGDHERMCSITRRWALEPDLKDQINQPYEYRGKGKLLQYVVHPGGAAD